MPKKNEYRACKISDTIHLNVASLPQFIRMWYKDNTNKWQRLYTSVRIQTILYVYNFCHTDRYLMIHRVFSDQISFVSLTQFYTSSIKV